MDVGDRRWACQIISVNGFTMIPSPSSVAPTCAFSLRHPMGLEGSDIPLCGQITAVADVYDALTSKRVYKDAFRHDVSQSIICKESGEHFDPEIVDAFLETREQFIEIQQHYADGSSADVVDTPAAPAAAPPVPCGM